ncbi:Rha family transcriptional regulator [Paenibacillus fonticola]|uniref:Rha family transcriptional regulator n=1 Tax=Paenibacillus fonticola TaxID=379896 RepID=UPI00036CFF69|nr:Rha family transcriptional regulator [Paenibacillus fonticola]
MNQLVFIENGKTVTDSLTVAETFGKEHKNVLRDIETLECSEEFSRLNFEHSTYINDRGRSYPKYIITQDGFSFLVMGYTGKEAAMFKELYISEFNRMRDELNKSPRTQLEVLLASAQQLVEQERRLSLVESRIERTEKQQEDIKDILALNPTDARKKVNQLLNKIAQSAGGVGSYQDVRTESYKKLEERARCDLAKRVTNKKQRLALEGLAKSKIDKINNLDVIFEDGRLAEIYFAIVKEMAVANRIEVEAS